MNDPNERADKLAILLNQAIALLRQAEPQLPHGDYGVAVDIRDWLKNNAPDSVKGK